MNWYHSRRGQYTIQGKEIAVDWARLFLHPEHAESTVIHELAHAIIADFDFGQATENFFSVSGSMAHLSETDREKMKGMLVEAHTYVQEGNATLMQVLNLGDQIGKRNAHRWAVANLPKDYLDKLHTFDFVFAMSRKYRDRFTDVNVRLAMEAGMRKVAPGKDIFRSRESLSTYLANPDFNPDVRLAKIVELVKYRPGMMTRPLPEIAAAAGITYFGPPTKQEVADFLNHICVLGNIAKTFVEADIGETPSAVAGYLHHLEDMTIGNLNMNFTGNSEMFPDEDALLHYADVIEVILLLPAGPGIKQIFQKHGRPEPELVFAMFRPSGEKYTIALTNDRAEALLNGPLSHVTLIVKSGGFDTEKNSMIGTKNMRHADVVIHNNVKSLAVEVDKIIASNADATFGTLYAGASPNHSFRMLIVRCNQQHPIHLVNTIGDAMVSNLFEKFSGKSTILIEEQIRERERQINNVMAVWMGMSWDVNWVKSMVLKDTLYHRPKGT